MADQVYPVHTGPLDALLVVDQDVVQRMGVLVRHLCVGMIDEAVRVTVLSRTPNPRLGEGIGPARFVMLPRSRWPWQRLNGETLLQRLDGRRPHVIHAMTVNLARWIWPLCAPWRARLAAQVSDLHDVGQFLRLNDEQDIAALALTDSIERAIVEVKAPLAERVHVVPPGLPANAEPCCRLLPERVPACIFASPLTRDCGLEVVLKALKLVVKAGQELQFFILSSGRSERLFRRMVSDLELRRWVTFAGELGDWTTLRRAMEAADVLIASSPSQRYSATSLTALACGLAILAPAGTCEDYLIDGKTARLFDSERPSSLADQWLALLKDPEATRQIAREALDHARSRHQASLMVGTTAFFYRKLVGAPDPVSADA